MKKLIKGMLKHQPTLMIESFNAGEELLIDIFPQLINDPKRFHQYFRMSYDKFCYLHNLIKTDIYKQNTQFHTEIPTEHRLALCLR